MSCAFQLLLSANQIPAQEPGLNVDCPAYCHIQGTRTLHVSQASLSSTSGCWGGVEWRVGGGGGGGEYASSSAVGCTG